VIWQASDGYCCADLVDGCFRNHRMYADLRQALEKEIKP
jgi:hypothetical protein